LRSAVGNTWELGLPACWSGEEKIPSSICSVPVALRKCRKQRGRYRATYLHAYCKRQTDESISLPGRTTAIRRIAAREVGRGGINERSHQTILDERAKKSGSIAGELCVDNAGHVAETRCAAGKDTRSRRRASRLRILAGEKVVARNGSLMHDGSFCLERWGIDTTRWHFCNDNLT